MAWERGGCIFFGFELHQARAIFFRKILHTNPYPSPKYRDLISCTQKRGQSWGMEGSSLLSRKSFQMPGPWVLGTCRGPWVSFWYRAIKFHAWSSPQKSYGLRLIFSLYPLSRIQLSYCAWLGLG